MRVIKPAVFFIDEDWDKLKRKIEFAGRKCYKSEDKINELSANGFIRGIVRSGHLSVVEHASVSFLVVCDRGVSHELVRHRIASFSQESTRYCNYSKDKFGNELTFIEPFFYLGDEVLYEQWLSSCTVVEEDYMYMLGAGAEPQEARSVLNNSLKTEIVVTMNMRELRHFFQLRCAKPAHPQMRQIAIPALLYMQKVLPEIFGDIEYDRDFPVEYYAEVGELEC